MTVKFDPKKKHDILKVIIECLEQILDETPEIYEDTVKDILKLFKMPNKEGIWPAVYFIMSNRQGGKTYTIAKLLLYMSMYYDKIFALHCHNKNQLGDFANGVMFRVLEDCFPDYHMTEKKIGAWGSRIMMIHKEDHSLDKHVGFLLPLRSKKEIKDNSSELSKIDVVFMDEFQSDVNIPNETDNFKDIHASIARGKSPDGINYGVRYVPTIMCSNSLSITNKYLAMFRIMSKIQQNTKFYRGQGVSLLRFKNEGVAEAQRLDPFNMGLDQDDKVLSSNIDNAWLNDNMACVSKPDNWGQGYYVCTIVDGKNKYGVTKYPNMGYYYLSRRIDVTDTCVYNIAPGGVENVPLIRGTIVFDSIRRAYAAGLCRFSDLGIKSLMEKLWL